MHNTEYFDKQLNVGQQCERKWAELFTAIGYNVQSSYQLGKQDKPPKIIVGGKEYTEPDIILNKEGSSDIWLDIKRKKTWTHWQGQIESGLNTTEYDDYYELVIQHGKRIYLIMEHVTESPCGIYTIEISEKNNSFKRNWNGLVGGIEKSKPLTLFNINKLTKIDLNTIMN